MSRWSDKERLDPEHFYSRRYIQKSEVLKRPEIKLELENLHKRFVVCVVDKASNNFAIICKKYYLIRLAEELGIDTGRFRNCTYSKINQTEEELCAILKTQINQRFELQIPDEYLKGPVLHWIPKFHKNPIKFRFIARSRNKVLTMLEIEVQKLLNLLESHFKNYC